MRSHPCLAALAACAILLALLPSAPLFSAAAAKPHALAETLRQAGAWVGLFADESVAIVGSEEYTQEWRRTAGKRDEAEAPSLPAALVERRTLVSDVAVVKTPVEEARAGYPWVQFRDVLEVDGEVLPDHRGRLERLLAAASATSRGEAARLTAESARYNIGPGPRTVNVPLFALFFLVPANQSRFRFEWKGETSLDGARVAVVGYRERERPTMIRSPSGEDRPARGLLWIDASGRVVQSRLEVDGDHRWTMETQVTLGQDAHVQGWVPLTMVERHRRGRDETLDCTAKYSNYRRFSTGARLIDR